MRKILVTGAAGYIGSHEVITLVENGFEPILIDDFSNSIKEIVIPNIEQIIGRSLSLYEVNCCDYESLKGVFEKETNVEGVIHFAAYRYVNDSYRNPSKYYRNNIDSLLNVVQLMKEFQIMNLVFSSSCTVYGQPDVIPVDEHTPWKDAESPYGYTKQVCERILLDEMKAGANLKIGVLRYFNPIGAHPSGLIGELPIAEPNTLIPYLTQTAIGVREVLSVFGNDYNTKDGTCVRDYIDILDLTEAHVNLLDWLVSKNGSFLEVFNVGTGEGSTVLDIVNTFQAVNNVEVNFKIAERRSGDVEKIYSSIHKATKELGWMPKRTISDSLATAWKWQKYIHQKMH